MPESGRRALHLLTLGLVLATAVTLAPLWTPLVLAAWVADLLRPASRRLERLLRGRRRGAAGIVVLFVVVALVPLAGMVVALASGIHDLLERARFAFEGKESVSSVLLGHDGSSPLTFHDWAEIASRHGAAAWQGVMTVMKASASLFLSVLVFIVMLYALVASGSRSYRWFAKYMPIPRIALHRFTQAFRETGRALIVAGGGTAIIQGLTATIAYAIIGIPNAALLGPLTGLCSVVPAIGSGLVWIPLGIELVATGEYARAIAVLAVGAGVIGVVDNLVRPALTRRARLKLPTSVVLVSMIGGIAVFGATGVLLGPLVVRLTVEGLAIAHSEHWFTPPPAAPVTLRRGAGAESEGLGPAFARRGPSKFARR
jgi:predicted PurR-regulated permease PerM